MRAARDHAFRTWRDVTCVGGTTGQAKGVMLSHANLWSNAMVTATAFGFDEDLVHLHAGPLISAPPPASSRRPSLAAAMSCCRASRRRQR